MQRHSGATQAYGCRPILMATTYLPETVPLLSDRITNMRDTQPVSYLPFHGHTIAHLSNFDIYTGVAPSGALFFIIKCTETGRGNFRKREFSSFTGHPTLVCMDSIMSRQSKTEYIAQKRTKYDCAKSRRVKGRLIGEVIRTPDVFRKYAIRLLTGNRVYRSSKGRGATYSEATIKLMIELWHLVNEPNAKYFVAQMERFLNDLKALREVPQQLTGELLRMSSSTIERKLRGEPRQPPGALRRSYRRKNTKSFEFVSIDSGEDIPAYHVEPGDIQVDTVALCGGDMRGNFI